MKMKKKILIAIPIALLVILFAWRIFGGTSKKKEMGRGGPQAVPVETANVEIMDLDDSAIFSGNLKAAGSFILSPKVAGQLAQLFVDIGDTVSRGQVVAQLEDSLFRLEFDKAKANLAQAASSLSEAQKALEHSRQLLAKHYISQDEFDRVSASLASEQAKYNASLAVKNAAEIQRGEKAHAHAVLRARGVSGIVGAHAVQLAQRQQRTRLYWQQLELELTSIRLKQSVAALPLQQVVDA